MARIVGDFLVERLREWSASMMSGDPGDGSGGVFGAAMRRDPGRDMARPS